MIFPRSALFGALVLWLTTHASVAMALDVSGVISTNTIWRTTDAPIRVVGDIEIRANARLTIEPGVRVEFVGSTKFDVINGALVAIGTSSQRIVFTSANASPAPGAWGPIGFQDGTLDATTELDFVDVAFGKGINISRASPRINRTSFANNQGAAIALDLLSSPTGLGLTATANGLNGISIPAGTITGSVRWGLVGIPYVVQQGSVFVGALPLTVSPTTTDVRVSATRQLTVTLAKPAPSGGWTFDVTSSAPTIALVPATLTIPAGGISGSVQVTGVAPGAATISVSRVELGAVSSAVTVLPPLALSFAPTSVTVPVGQSRTLTLQSSEAVSASTTISLSTGTAGVVSVPPTVSLGTGSSSTSVTITGENTGTTTLIATAPGFTSATANVDVRRAFLSFGPFGVVAPGASRSIAISLSETAPTGRTIALSSSNPAIATIEPNVFVPAGQLTASATVSGVALGTSTLTATTSGYDSATTTATVDTLALRFEPVGPVTVQVGTSLSVRVRSNRPAPAGGLAVSVSSAPATALTLTPSAFTIPEGTTSATVPLTITGNAIGSATITAQSLDAISTTLTVNIAPQPRLEIGDGSLLLGRGLTTEVDVRRVQANGQPLNGTDALVVSLASSDPARVTLPTVVTIPAGQSSIRARVFGLQVGAGTTLTATAMGYASTPTTAGVVAPTILFNGLADQRYVGEGRDSFDLRLDVSGSNEPSQVAAADIDVGVALSNLSPAGVVAGIFADNTSATPRPTLTVRAGRNSSQQSGFVGTPSLAGSYRIAATIGGDTPALSSVQQVLAGTPELAFSQSSISVGKGFREYVQLSYRIGGQDVPVAVDTVINLAPSASGKVAIPGSIVISAGQTSATFELDGVDLTPSPVSVAASSPGIAAPANLDVTVQLADIVFDQFFTTFQTVGDTRMPFRLGWNGAVSSDRTVTIELVDRNPSNVVEAIYANAQGPEQLQPFPILQGSSGTDFVYAGAPVAPGTYRFRVLLEGAGEWFSELVTVTNRPQSIEIRTGGETEEFAVGRLLTSTAPTVSRIGFPLDQPLTIQLSSSSASQVAVPVSVTIPALQDSASLPITGLAISSGTTITASVAAMPSLTDQITVNVVEPEIIASELSGTRGVGGIRDSVSVSWYVATSDDRFGQFRTTDTTVQLAIVDQVPTGIVQGVFSSSAGAVQDSQLVIPGGQSSSVVIDGGRRFLATPTAVGTYRVTTAAMGHPSWISELQMVVAPQLAFSATQARVGHRLVSTGVAIRRTANGFFEATHANLPIAIDLSAAGIVGAPAQIVMPAGAAFMSIPLEGLASGDVILSGSAPEHVFTPSGGAVDVRVLRPRLELLSVPFQMGVGTNRSVGAGLVVPGPTAQFDDRSQRPINPLSILLTSAFPGVASVTSPLIIPTTASSATTAQLTGVAPGFTTISASAADMDGVTSNSITVTSDE